MPAFTYEKIKSIFEEKDCKLLTTKEEFINDKMNAKFSKFNIISKCGHERLNCRFKEFKSKNIGILCLNCQNIEKIKKLKNNEGMKIERISIQILKKCISNLFDIEIMSEATKADVGIRLKNCSENKWFPIQLKCTSKPKYTVFNFSLNNRNYDNMFLMCISLEPVKIWLFNSNDNNIRNKDKISIGMKSQHNKNEIELKNLENLLIENINLYPNYCKTLEELNTPINISAIQEREYVNLRKKIFKNIKFIEGVNGSVVDFTINGYKIQEKIGQFEKSSKYSIRFTLDKTFNGLTCQPYNLNDNHYYWLHFPNKEHFLFIPAQVLYDNGFLSIDNNTNTKRKVSLQFCINKIPNWIKDHVYEYKFEIEIKILNLFNNLPKKELENEIIDVDALLENNDIKTQAYLDSKCKAQIKQCVECKAVLTKFNAIRCIECNYKNQIIESRNSGRPSYLTLINLLKTNSYQNLADKYNVSRQAVFYWVKKYEKYNLTDI